MNTVSIDKFFVRLNLVRYKSHNTNSFPKQFITYVITHNSNIITTRLFFIRLQKIKKKAGGLPHRQLTDFDGKSTTVANIFPARLRASCSAAPTDTCKPTPLAE